MNRPFSMLWPQRPSFLPPKSPQLPGPFGGILAAALPKPPPLAAAPRQRSATLPRSQAIWAVHRSASCLAIGEATGQPIGEAIGQPIGEATSQPIGEATSQPIGKAIGKAIGQLIGKATGLPIGKAASHPPGYRAGMALGLWALLGLAACGGPIALAPFPARPDTVVPGSLLGPFDGQVVDQGTTNPVAGALVLGTWAFETPAGLATPEASYAESTQTGNDGTYRLPALPTGRYEQGLLRRFSLIVYKAGYFGYRSDLRSDDRSPRHDFAQRKNRIRLDRFTLGESHAKHLVFLGASPQLRRAAQAEIVQASLEIVETTSAAAAVLAAEEQAPPVPPPPEPVELTLPMRLLTRADVEEWAAGATRTYTLAPLPATDADVTAGSEAVHYKAQDSAESWDAALRVWHTPSGAAAKAIFTRLRAKIGTPPLRDGAGAAQLVPLPPARSATPLLAEVPAVAPSLRDAAGQEHPLAPPAVGTPSAAKAAPLVIDDALQVYDAKLRIYGVVVLSRRLGVVLQLTCGADLCKTQDGAVRLMTRVLGRL